MTTEYEALDRLQEQCWSFGIHRVITVAGKAGVLRALSLGQRTPEALADELELDPLATGKVVRALCALGIAEPSAQGAYRVVDDLREYLGAGEEDLTPFLAHSHHLYESWAENLEPWLRGETWTPMKRDPAATRAFGRAMQAMGSQQARRLAGVLDQQGARTLLDVGGGFGHYARALCRVNPALTAVVFDRPEVAEMARANIAGTEWEGRLSFRGGDYLGDEASEDRYGEGFDLVLLANVVHQELPARAEQMVARAARAAAPGGRVVVLDFSIDEARQQSVVGALFAINMRSFGDTYTEPVIRGWMERAGLARVARTDLGPQRWIIVGRK